MKKGYAPMLLLCGVVLASWNAMLLINHDYMISPSTFGSGGAMIASTFFESRAVVEETKDHSSGMKSNGLRFSPYRTDSSNNNNIHNINDYHHQPRNSKARILIGILTGDSENSASYRKRHRTLFESVWNDTRVCNLPTFQDKLSKPLPETTGSAADACQIVYTFIVGANPDSDGPTEIVDDSIPLLYDKEIPSNWNDINDADVTRLNIRENMNEGKSQTFFYFASRIMKEHGLDYAMKLDSDSILHLHDFLLFSDNHLPPAPYNTNILAGALRNKAGWPPNPDKAQLPRLESWFGNQYEGVHLYIAGQCYILSLDLCQHVAMEAPFSRVRVAEGGYIEGHEDHDISAMAFHSPSPVHMLTIGKSQRFWEHPVKGQPRWERIIRREEARMKQVEFEGRILRLY